MKFLKGCAIVALVLLLAINAASAIGNVVTWATGGSNRFMLDSSGNWNIFNAPAVRIFSTTDNYANPTAGNSEWLEVTYDNAVPADGGYKIIPKASGSGSLRGWALRGSSGACGVNMHTDNNLDLFGSHVGISCPVAYDRSGVVIYMNGVALKGYGVPATRSSGAAFAQSTLQASVASIVSGVFNGGGGSPYPDDPTATYAVDVWLDIITAGPSSLNETVAFVDEHGGNQTFTLAMTNAAGTASTSALTATGYYYGRAFIRAKDYNGASVVVTETGTSPTSHDVGATITQFQGVQ